MVDQQTAERKEAARRELSEIAYTRMFLLSATRDGVT
jgi:hypothetical protein